MNRQSAESATPVARLRGMPDFTGDALRRREQIQRSITALLGSFGYQGLDTPLLEPTELFLRKSGGELASQLFSFTDPGSRAVSLRPEFTAPAIRHYLENSSQIDLPARWQYCGPVFRFDGASLSSPDQLGGNGQFTQIGGELLGSSSVMADVELLELAVSVLSESGLTGWTLRLADLGLLNSLLDPLDLSDRARTFVVQSVPLLGAGPTAIPGLLDSARSLHLFGRPSGDDYLSQAVYGLGDDEARNVLLGVLRSNPLDQLGQRRPEEVVERLLRKIRRPDAEETLRMALEAASELAQVRGRPSDALLEAVAVLNRGGSDTQAPQRLDQTLQLLPDLPDAGGSVVLDLSLVRGLAYYNGIIFEVSHPGWPGAIGGGGRYDGLARDLGGAHRLPALGFAYNLDALEELTRECASISQTGSERVLVVASSEAARSAALKEARKLRSMGKHAITEVAEREMDEARDFAFRGGFSTMAIVYEDGSVDTQEF